MSVSRNLLISIAASALTIVFYSASAAFAPGEEGNFRVIGLSPSISRGGSAVIIFEALSSNISPYIMINHEKVII
ncbi:MAG: hypothetical protein ABSG94_09275, partial [Brevinematales bacterium]